MNCQLLPYFGDETERVRVDWSLWRHFNNFRSVVAHLCPSIDNMTWMKSKGKKQQNLGNMNENIFACTFL